MRRAGYALSAVLVLAPLTGGFLGHLIGPELPQPMNLNPDRVEQVNDLLAKTGATKQDFVVRAPDGAELCG